MKQGMISLLTLTGFTGILWAVLGGVVLAVGLGALILLCVALSAFALGSWWTGQIMERGANIALKAQVSDDRRDTVQLNAIAGLVKETLKLRDKGSAGVVGYPALSSPAGRDVAERSASYSPNSHLPDEAIAEGDFIIEGLEDN